MTSRTRSGNRDVLVERKGENSNRRRLSMHQEERRVQNAGSPPWSRVFTCISAQEMYSVVA